MSITIETCLEPISNYFLERLTSSFVEGFNNRVKILKRPCYDIFDVDRLFQRLTLDIHGYERFSLTLIYPISSVFTEIPEESKIEAENTFKTWFCCENLRQIYLKFS